MAYFIHQSIETPIPRPPGNSDDGPGNPIWFPISRVFRFSNTYAYLSPAVSTLWRLLPQFILQRIASKTAFEINRALKSINLKVIFNFQMQAWYACLHFEVSCREYLYNLGFKILVLLNWNIASKFFNFTRRHETSFGVTIISTLWCYLCFHQR